MRVPVNISIFVKRRKKEKKARAKEMAVTETVHFMSRVQSTPSSNELVSEERLTIEATVIEAQE
jgi:hypothetical protein